MKRQIWKIDFDHNQPEEARKSGGARGCSISGKHMLVTCMKNKMEEGLPGKTTGYVASRWNGGRQLSMDDLQNWKKKGKNRVERMHKEK